MKINRKAILWARRKYNRAERDRRHFRDPMRWNLNWRIASVVMFWWLMTFVAVEAASTIFVVYAILKG